MHKSVLTVGFLSCTLIILSVMPFFDFNNVANATRALPISEGPIINDVNLKAEVVFEGLTSPTSIAFLGSNDILVLEKDKGTVKRIVNGNILAEPLLEVNVANDGNRGMLGIAVSKGEEINSTNIFLYFTEAPLGEFPIGNRVYKYELVNNKLVNPQVLLNLPAVPGPSHNGGALMIGPDDNIYTIIGDVGGHRNQAQNQESGGEPDATSGMLRITPDGMPVVNSPLGDREPLNLYYSYGVRNSFGFDFDPITGKLWNTENGEDFGDETTQIANEIESKGYRLFTLGVGTEQGGQIRSGAGFRTDRQGSVVVTRLKPDALKSLASSTGGRYFEVNESRNDVARLINTINAIEGELMDARFVDVSANKYFYFLLAAVILLILDVLIHVKTIKI